MGDDCEAQGQSNNPPIDEATGSMAPPMSTQEKIEYWLEIAEYDLKSAKAMQKVGQYLHVGFMCQQTLEKALKAVIAKTGAFPPKTHDLLRLAELADIARLLSKEQEQLLDDIYPLNTEGRYPSYKTAIARTLNKRICREYINQTEAMLKWIKETLN